MDYFSVEIEKASMARRDYVLNALASYPTQHEAAIALGTCPRVVSQWSNNKAVPRDLAVRVIQLIHILKEKGIPVPPPLELS